MSASSPTVSPRLRVYGTGLVHSLGGLAEVARAVQQHRHTPSFAPAGTDGLGEHIAPKALRRIPHYARMGLAAALQALQALPPQVERADLALVVATAHAGQKMGLDFMDSILDGGPRLSSPTAFSHAVNNMGAGLISLHLGIHGPCCTVTQFGLSLAGALQASGLLLHGGQAPLVLLGCIDEWDPRFTATCAAHLGHTTEGYSEGAAFFLLGRADGAPCGLTGIEHAGPGLAVSWDTPDPQATPTPAHADVYGTTPLAPALDALLALQAQRVARIACANGVGNGASGRQAVIHVYA